MSDAGASPVAAAFARGAYAAAGLLAGAAAAAAAPFAGGEAALRLRERRGLWAGHDATPGPWLWVHGASVGEAEIATAIARGLAAHRPDLRLVVSATTAGGWARAGREAGIENRYFPIDCARFVNRILERRPPLLFVAVETEIWPATLQALASRGVPAAVANARLSDRSLPRYLRLRPLLAPLLGGLVKVAARDDEAAGRWARLGVRPEAIQVTGNIKFDLATACEDAGLPTLSFGDGRPVLLAASTHDPEEELALDAFAEARRQGVAATLVVAPRHVERAGGIAALAAARGFSVRRWSDAAPVARDDADVVVLDRLGLLRAAYAASAAAFVGGSVVAGPGGHNLLEAVIAGCPVAAGSRLENVRDQAELLRAERALATADTVAQLSRFWVQVLAGPQEFRAPLDAARRRIDERRGALARTVLALLPLLEARR